MIKSSIKRAINALLRAAILYSSTAFCEINFDSEVRPNTISLGESANWIITAENAIIRQTTFRPPAVQNLKITYETGSFNTRIINGVTQRSTVWKFKVTPTAAGDYVIPASNIIIEGNDFVIPSCSFSVTSNANNSSKKSDVVFMKLDYKQPDKWYIGQSCKAELKLFIPSEITGQLASMPQKHGDAFSATKLIAEPKQNTVRINSTSYQCISWETLITPLKSGISQLHFEIDMSISIPSRLRSTMLDDEDDPFAVFARGFGGMFAQNKTVSLETEVETINVLPLASNRPANFTEGIGVFKLSEPQMLEKEAIQNEPITLVVEISGSGNFERLQEPKIICNDEIWRTYSPKSVFESSDFLGFNGKVRYEFTAVPLKSGDIELPAIDFVYFDTNIGEFVSLKSSTNSVICVKPPIRSKAKINSLEDSKPTTNESFLPNGIILQFEKLSKPHGGFMVFWIMQIFALFAFVIFVFFRHRLAKNIANPLFVAKKLFLSELDICLNNAKAALNSKNVAAWYDAANKALNIAFSLKMNSLSKLEINSVDDILEAGIKLSEGSAKFVSELLDTNNLIKFGDGNQHFPSCTDNFYKLLKELK